ncbi:MAG: choice-of-anchor E domain-containing protein [Chitinophagaceae bacterium]
MNCLYKSSVLRVFSLISTISFFQAAQGQCPDGQAEGGTAFDTTITFTDGSHNSQIKFPKFDPEQGMVTCAKLTMNVTSTLNFMFFENRDNSPNTAEVIFSRNDVITGPGLSSPLSNSETNGYGPYNLAPKDAVPNSGPDYLGIGPVEIFNKTKIVNISDFNEFYGVPGDSLIYNYTATGTTQNNTTGNWFGGVDASGSVSYKLELCYCPAAILPLNVRAFDLFRLSENAVDLKWNGVDDSYDNYHYEAEVSRTGSNFSTIGSFSKKINTNDPYKLSFTAKNGEHGIFYFRIKQVYSNGYVRYSNIRQVKLENSVSPKFLLYPNPSKGIVGIKFDNSVSGQFSALIYNAQGQMTVKKDIVITAGSSYVKLAVLVPGVYWIRINDKKGLESCVNQLLIK